MKKLLALALVAFASCSMLGARHDIVDATKILPAATKVVQRHDAYVVGDARLAPMEASMDLEQSRRFVDMLASAVDGKVYIGLVSGDARAISARHDSYVNQDVKLDELQRRVYLRSSALLLKIVEQAEAGAEPSPKH